MIDIRSDTVTIPTPEMRIAMAEAVVGDDVYSEDQTVEDLQHTVASMFGKEAALFVPSGTMGNQICLAIHAQTGDEIIADADAHIFHYENAAAAVIARAQIHGIRSEYGQIALEEIESAIRPSAYYYPRTAVVALENSHNRHGGTVLPMEYLRLVRNLCNEKGLPLHCDGARVWNAIAAVGCTHQEMGAVFDTLSICLSKGLGAPAGSLILGTRAIIEKARRWRKMLGGGMRQVGVLAAAAKVAIETVLPKLAEDHLKAKHFATGIASHPLVTVQTERVQTNVVMFTVLGINDSDFIQRMFEKGVRIATIKPGVMRAVFHHQIQMGDVEHSVDAVLKSVEYKS